ncbi:hypothetical protein P2318_12780 [Myxococcaceae bacterium GXIMD 01537]
MNTWILRCLLGGLVLATPALAQDDDAPYAYPDEASSDRDEDDAPRRSRYADPGDEFREAAEHGDEAEGFQRMYRRDDTNTGIAAEVLGGALLLDSSRGAAADTTLGFGLRLTWEFGRLLDSERLREALWADARWTYGSLSDGTELIAGKTNIHFFTLAPAYELKLAGTFGVYAQLGLGAALQTTSLTIGQQETVVNGLKPVFQYGVGLRARPRLSEKMSLAVRLEVTRFRRGYMDDTFIGASVGPAF